MFTLTPFFYALMAVYFLIIVAAAWVVYDSSQPQRSRQLARIEDLGSKHREPLVAYRIYCAIMVVLYLLNLLFGFLPFVRGTFAYQFSILSFAWALVGIFVIIAYLLRVVFPKEKTLVENTLADPASEDREVPVLEHESSDEAESIIEEQLL
ncbi:MAG: hypothetical protein FWD41_01550 [Actinomycetia bacterium]|nr:hypothetical protein [Actinomycetes bacterium]